MSKDTHAYGYGYGSADTVLSVDEVTEQAEALGSAVAWSDLQALCAGPPVLKLRDVRAGYGAMEILHGLDLCVGGGQSLCLVGPNGAGKSTVLHTIVGLASRFDGSIEAQDRAVGGADPAQILMRHGIAYVLQDNSVFPDMTVEENLLMGGYLLARNEARAAASRVLERYDRLAARARERAGVLSGGERRLLEIARALIMDPKILLIDEPSIGLEPRYIDMVFEILGDLKERLGMTILLVEQNAKRGLEFADIGYVLVSGRVRRAGVGGELVRDPDIGRLFLGG